MPNFESDSVIYEHPLSERTRAMLRIEFFFHRSDSQILAEDTWSSRCVVESIIDMLEVMRRSDLRKELLKELERQSTILEALSSNPNVENRRLEKILAQVRKVHGTLLASENAPGIELRDIEILSIVRRRSGILAGTCAFDLPAYHFWLQNPARRRLQDLRTWLSKFDRLREATELCLKLIRESATATREVARGGFFQKTLDTSNHCQMIRVLLPYHTGCYPEFIAGPQRFTVRFMRPSQGSDRPLQTEEDVEFKLFCCVL